MKVIPVGEAEGTVLCHDITEIVPGRRKGPAFRKGHVVRKEDIPRLLDLGKEHLYVWEADASSLHEDEAAMRIARALAGPGLTLSEPAEGKVRLTAAVPGLLKVRSEALASVNDVDQVCVATLHSNRLVEQGQTVGGCRVVPLVIAADRIDRVESLCRAATTPVIEVRALRSLRVGIVTTGKIRQEDDQRRYIGQIDLPLAEEGRRQAEHLRRRMEHAEIGAVYCSDLVRSRETADIAAGGRFEVIARPDLREISMGEWEARTLGEVARQFPDEYRARGEDIAGFRVPGGESFVECARRVVPAFEEIVARSTGNVLVVGHAGVNRLILCHVLGMPVANLFRIGQDYSCLNIIQCSNSGHQVRLVNGRTRSGGR